MTIAGGAGVPESGGDGPSGGINPDVSSGGIDPDVAQRVIAAALAQPGGGVTVITQLANLPGTRFVQARPGKMFRRAEPAAVQIDDQQFAAEDNSTRLQARHVVRDVVLQTTEYGAAEAARVVMQAVARLVEVEGQPAADALDVVIYGLAATTGLV